MEFGDWVISWPNLFSSKTTIQLPVKFRLVLEEGSSKSNCSITQFKKGRTEQGGDVDTFTTWTRDDSGTHWWNGSDWYGGDGSWDWFGNDAATFKDKPGFQDIPKSAFPVYWGGVARGGFFEFRTVVYAAADGVNPMTEVASLHWGMMINVRSPARGGITLTNACNENGDIGETRL